MFYRKLLLAGAGLAVLGATPMPRIPDSQTLSAAEQAEGSKANPDLLAEYGGSYTGSQAAYANRIGHRVAGQSGIADPDHAFTINLLNSPVENAFAIPGGYIYCTRQLMALANDEAEMAFILGHESGHVAAHHAAKRARVAQRDTILGALGQGLAGALLGKGALGQLAKQGIANGVQYHVMSYSRAEEFEADDLGVLFTQRAGYDPRAASDMLASLAAQVALDQKLAGTRARSSWSSSHPDPASRVQRALERAQELKSTSTYRNNDAFLMSLKGMLYGDDPQQGVVEGQTFKHPVLRFQFSAPAGTQMENTSAAVNIAGANGQATFTGGRSTGDLGAYIDTVFKGLSGQNAAPHSSISHSTINGMDVASATAAAQTQNGQMVDVSVVAYQFSPTLAYHFLIITPQGQGLGEFAQTVSSFRRMTAAEAAAVRPRKIDIVTVKRGDSVASLASRMAFNTAQEERFRILNGLRATDTLTPGRKVKTVIWG